MHLEAVFTGVGRIVDRDAGQCGDDGARFDVDGDVAERRPQDVGPRGGEAVDQDAVRRAEQDHPPNRPGAGASRAYALAAIGPENS